MVPFYRSGLIWGVVLFFVGGTQIKNYKDIAALIMLVGLGMFFIALIRRFIWLVKRKNHKVIHNPEPTIKAEPKPAQAFAAIQPDVQTTQPQGPFVPPETYHGSFLGYSYDDVEIDIDQQNLEVIQNIPVHTILSIKRIEDRVELYHDNTRIGEMRKNKLKTMTSDFLRDPDRSAMAVLISSSPILIGFYFYVSGKRFIDKIRNEPNAKEYKLISNKNSEMQDNIGVCDIGDLVSIDMDYEKDKYLVSMDNLDVGYMPASFTKYIDEHGEVEGRISTIIESENGDDKFEIYVIVIPKK